MPHVRTGIRSALVAVLTGLSTTGTRVHASRMYPRADGALPCLLVITSDEPQIDEGLSNQPILERTLEVSIRAVVKASASLDTTIDNIIAEVETALGAVTTLGGLIKGLSLVSIGIDYDDATDKPVGAANINYRATYFTLAGSPATAL